MIIRPYKSVFFAQVCHYNVKNPHKNMWELKPEYRHYKAKAEEEAKPDDDDSSDDDWSVFRRLNFEVASWEALSVSRSSTKCSETIFVSKHFHILSKTWWSCTSADL